MNLKLVLSLLVLLTANASLHAQKNGAGQAFHELGYLSWDISSPKSDFVKKTSLSGGTFGFRKMLKNKKVSIGADFSWNSYYEYAPTATYQLKDGAVTTDLYKYLYTSIPTINAHYYFGGGGDIHPYAGLALGAAYADEQLYYNTFVTEDTQWGFLVRPEVGALIKVNPQTGWGILAAVRYSYSTNKQTEFKIDNLQAIGFQLGVVWGW
jgi:hypothetical protein